MYKLLPILFCFFSLKSLSHPGIGIVRDSKGFIYYTDLEQVWKIDPNTLNKVVAVPNVHTHELFMDENDNLFGQHSLYSGEQTNKWSHYVWKLNSNGILDTVVPVTDGFYIENFSFAGDIKGNQYWIQHWKTDRLIRKQKNGKSEVWYEGNLKNVQWMFPFNDKLYFVKEDDIYVIEKPGKIASFAQNLAGRKDGGHNSIFGIWFDKAENVYVANSDLKRVQKIGKEGKAVDFYQSEKGWFPTAGLFDEEDNLWLLECSSTNEIRVQKINKAALINSPTQATKKGSVSPVLKGAEDIVTRLSDSLKGALNWIFIIAAGVLITAAFLLFIKRKG